MTEVRELLGGWGNCPRLDCRVERPSARPALLRAVHQVALADSNCIARGLGRSYGDSSLNEQGSVLIQTGLNRLLGFDRETGLVTCEAGVSFDELIQIFLPRGWFLPTTPGTRFVTVGGAIAADVHGKNHHSDGSFGRFVERIWLLTADGSIRCCGPAESRDLFCATVGGMGLTGIIVAASFRLMPVETAWFDVTFRRTESLEQTLEAFQQTDGDYRYSVAWIDCLARGRSLGRSVLMLAGDGRVRDLPASLQRYPFDVPVKRAKSVPFSFPRGVLNPLSVRAFNECYYRTHRDGRKFVDYSTFFYPLDGVQHWNRIYGRSGFVQYQALFPRATSHEGLVALLERVSKSRRASFLAVLKSSGPQGDGLLSYMSTGHTLALDFPDTGEDLRPFLRELDDILLRFGGKLYLAKDAMMSADTFRAMYPKLKQFREVRSTVDPENRFASTQARRLGIVDSASRQGASGRATAVVAGGRG
ncbi:MAG: FAD-binding oxidoreductase [Planctomycetaceae bacterium]|nr:FAD-binding oxidoreductase [Planctomycetaceae bacterium]